MLQTCRKLQRLEEKVDVCFGKATNMFPGIARGFPVEGVCDARERAGIEGNSISTCS